MYLEGEPKIALRDGLVRTIRYFDEMLKNGDWG